MEQAEQEPGAGKDGHWWRRFGLSPAVQVLLIRRLNRFAPMSLKSVVKLLLVQFFNCLIFQLENYILIN